MYLLCTITTKTLMLSSCTMLSNTFLYWVFIYWCTVAPYNVTITADFNRYVIAKSIRVENGDSLTLTCMTSGGPSNMFHWVKDGIDTYGSTLSINAITATDGGLYECVVNNTGGNSTAKITIYCRTCISHNTLYIV